MINTIPDSSTNQQRQGAAVFRKSNWAKGLLALGALAFVAGCASAKMKARKEERNKLAQSSGLYCDFVNNEIHSDVEVQLNMEMSKKCDNDKPFSISGFKTSNENSGIMYCCSLDPQAKLGDAAEGKSTKEDKKIDLK